MTLVEVYTYAPFSRLELRVRSRASIRGLELGV